MFKFLFLFINASTNQLNYFLQRNHTFKKFNFKTYAV